MRYRLHHATNVRFPKTIFKSIGYMVAVLAILASSLMVSDDANASITNTRADAIGTLEVAASNWLSGEGADIYSNGNSALNTSSKNCVSVAGAPGNLGCPAGTVASGDKWQCVELINRLYLSRGWTTSTWSGNGNTLKNNLPIGVTFQNNGSVTGIEPGMSFLWMTAAMDMPQ